MEKIYGAQNAPFSISQEIQAKQGVDPHSNFSCRLAGTLLALPPAGLLALSQPDLECRVDGGPTVASLDLCHEVRMHMWQSSVDCIVARILASKQGWQVPLSYANFV